MSTMPPVDPVLRIALRAALSLLFLWAAAHKLRDVAGFKGALAAYELLPRRFLWAFAAMLIATEIVIAAGLLAPPGSAHSEAGVGTGAALTAAGLLCVYTGAVVINLLRGRWHIDCGCIGAAQRRPLSSGLVARNGVLVVLALVSAMPVASRSLTWIDGVTIGAGVAALALLYAAVDGLIATGPRIAALARDLVPRGAFPLLAGTIDKRETRPSTGSGRAERSFESGSSTVRAELVEARFHRKSTLFAKERARGR